MIYVVFHNSLYSLSDKFYEGCVKFNKDTKQLLEHFVDVYSEGPIVLNDKNGNKYGFNKK